MPKAIKNKTQNTICSVALIQNINQQLKKKKQNIVTIMLIISFRGLNNHSHDVSFTQSRCRMSERGMVYYD